MSELFVLGDGVVFAAEEPTAAVVTALALRQLCRGGLARLKGMRDPVVLYELAEHERVGGRR